MFFAYQTEEEAILNACILRLKQLHNQPFFNRIELGEHEALSRWLLKHPLVCDIGVCSKHGLQVFLKSERENMEGM